MKIFWSLDALDPDQTLRQRIHNDWMIFPAMNQGCTACPKIVSRLIFEFAIELGCKNHKFNHQKNGLRRDPQFYRCYFNARKIGYCF